MHNQHPYELATLGELQLFRRRDAASQKTLFHTSLARTMSTKTVKATEEYDSQRKKIRESQRGKIWIENE